MKIDPWLKLLLSGRRKFDSFVPRFILSMIHKNLVKLLCSVSRYFWLLKASHFKFGTPLGKKLISCSPVFGRSVNPNLNEGGTLSLPHYYVPPPDFQTLRRLCFYFRHKSATIHFLAQHSKSFCSQNRLSLFSLFSAIYFS